MRYIHRPSHFLGFVTQTILGEQFSCTAVQLYSSSAVKQFSCTAVQFSCTALQLYSSSAVQHCSCTELQLYSSAAVQHCSCTALQLYSSAAVQQCSCKAVQLYSSAAVQQCSCTAVQFLLMHQFLVPMFTLSFTVYHLEALGCFTQPSAFCGLFCAHSLWMAQLVTSMTYVQEIHGSKSQWDFGSFCCSFIQMLVQGLKLCTEHWPQPVQSCRHLMLHPKSDTVFIKTINKLINVALYCLILTCVF